jgi:hypothetical protein
MNKIIKIGLNNKYFIYRSLLLAAEARYPAGNLLEHLSVI